MRNINVLVTRAEHQAEPLCQLIEQQGWNAIRFPTLEITAVDRQYLKQQLAMTDRYQWFIFISTNAVNFALKVNNGKIDFLQHGLIAAVGKSTEKALLSLGVKVDLVPEQRFNTEGLLATKEMQHVQGKSCLIIRGQGGREQLASCLRDRGAKVDYLEVYSRGIPVNNEGHVSRLLEQGLLDAITITSGDALKNLLVMINETLHEKLILVPLIVISERIKALAEKNKFKNIVVTDTPSDAAIIKTVVMSLKAQ